MSRTECAKADLCVRSSLVIGFHDPHISLGRPRLKGKMVRMVSSERSLMFTSVQYRAKAIEYGNLADASPNANEKHEFQKLQRRFAELAYNEEWLADHHKQTLHAADTEYSRDASLAREEPILRNEHSDDVRLAREEEQILRCLGAALIMQWGTLPRKLQRELFDNAGAMGDLLDTASLRGQIARFLQKNNGDCTSDD